jgi:TolB-like protein/DNA-binding winged helix-turn-helix (wHTH) protein/Tfp pilus assembly protein PilF
MVMFQFASFSVDPHERVVLRNGAPLSLTPKVFDTLLCFVRNPGRVLTKDELLKQIWPDTFVEEVNLAVNISTLRKALGESSQEGRYIATIPGRGYQFVAEVRETVSVEWREGNKIVGGQAMPPRVIGDLPASKWKVDVTGALRFVLPVLLILFFAAGGWYRFQKQRASAPVATAASIAVLPFVDLSPGKDQEYFSDGLTEELINDLSKVSGLKVVARSSAFQFKGRNEDLRSVGNKLGVTNILEGSVRKERDRFRISAELVKVKDGFQLWSETYDRKMEDILSVQDEIARSATRALQIKLLSPKDATVIGSERSANAEAYDAYQRARYFTTRGRDEADLDNALAYAEKAIKLDAKYASAWALRSYILDAMADVGLMEPATTFLRAREDAERAIELDSNSAAGYLALAWVQINRDWHWEAAELSLNKAAEREPGNAAILRYRSFLSQSLGRLNEAIKFFEQAMALDPLLASGQSQLAFLLYSAGEYEQAKAAAQKALELNPQKTYDHFTQGEILLARGQPLQALTEIEQEPAAIWKLTGEALAYHALGRSQDSNAALTQLIKEHQQTMAYQIAEVYAYRSDSDSAFQWLNRAYQQRDSGLRNLKIDPLLTDLRRDPRYAELLRKMHLPGSIASSGKEALARSTPLGRFVHQ